MTLGFKQQFPWATKDKPAPTYFREKILAGTGIVTINGDNINPSGPILQDGFKPKIHTMRADPHNRWKAGRKIEMVYRGAGYKILDHFNEGIPELEKCVSVQQIKLWVTGELGQIGNDDKRIQIIRVNAVIDGKRMEDPDVLIRNDGFDNKLQFARWFYKPFEGKIIHWTDLRY